MKHLFIINPKCFMNLWNMGQVCSGIYDFFSSAETEDYQVHISLFPREATHFVRSYLASVQQGTTVRVYAVGGDGILFDCLNGIMGSQNVELAAIPYGRVNNFVRGFGKQNTDLFRDIARQYWAASIPLDVIQSGNNYALSFCTIGFESEAVRLTQQFREAMERGGSFARWLMRRFYGHQYYLGALRAAGNYDILHQQYEIDLDGEDLSGQYWAIHFANGLWCGGNKSPLRTAQPDDGMLDILLLPAAGPLRALRLLPAFMSGMIHKFPSSFILKHGKKISLRSENLMYINSDGTPFFRKNLTMELLPGAVQFVDPRKKGTREVNLER